MRQTPIKVLLDRNIDYAGLFPPAKVSMSQAVDNYDAYREGADSWALGSFIVPVARLIEFETEARNPIPLSVGVHKWWWLSTINAAHGANLDADFSAELDLIDSFNRRHARDVPDVNEGKHHPSFIAVTTEVKVANPDEVMRVARVLVERDEHIGCYCEVSLNDTMLACLDALVAAPMKKDTKLLAKVRTGGLDASSFPSASQLLRFIAACRERNLPFKATAGLHHPLRGTHPFTYERDSACGTMHGFLNLFLAACFIYHGTSEREVAPLLEETSLDSFEFAEDGIAWRGARLDSDQLEDARSNFALSFGSCSFTEPLDDLRALDLL